MTFDPNQLLNNPATLLSLKGQLGVRAPEARPAGEKPPEPVPPPPYDKAMYENAYGRLGLLRIPNVAALGCGAGNYTGVITSRLQSPQV